MKFTFYLINFNAHEAFNNKRGLKIDLKDYKYRKHIIFIATATTIFLSSIVRDFLNITPSLTLKYMLLLFVSVFFEYFLITLLVNVCINFSRDV